jgi:hypothetical protein
MKPLEDVAEDLLSLFHRWGCDDRALRSALRRALEEALSAERGRIVSAITALPCPAGESEGYACGHRVALLAAAHLVLQRGAELAKETR